MGLSIIYCVNTETDWGRQHARACLAFLSYGLLALCSLLCGVHMQSCGITPPSCCLLGNSSNNHGTPAAPWHPLYVQAVCGPDCIPDCPPARPFPLPHFGTQQLILVSCIVAARLIHWGWNRAGNMRPPVRGESCCTLPAPATPLSAPLLAPLVFCSSTADMSICSRDMVRLCRKPTILARHLSGSFWLGPANAPL